MNTTTRPTLLTVGACNAGMWATPLAPLVQRPQHVQPQGPRHCVHAPVESAHLYNCTQQQNVMLCMLMANKPGQAYSILNILSYHCKMLLRLWDVYNLVLTFFFKTYN